MNDIEKYANKHVKQFKIFVHFMNVFFSRFGACPLFTAWRNIWVGLFDSGTGEAPVLEGLHSELFVLGFVKMTLRY